MRRMMSAATKSRACPTCGWNFGVIPQTYIFTVSPRGSKGSLVPVSVLEIRRATGPSRRARLRSRGSDAGAGEIGRVGLQRLELRRERPQPRLQEDDALLERVDRLALRVGEVLDALVDVRIR